MAILISKEKCIALLLGILCLLGIVLLRQFRPMVMAATQESSHIGRLPETGLVSISVTVLDKEGDPIHNLKKENFQLFEGGRELTLSGIREVREASAGEPPDNSQEGTPSGANSGKRVLILFDDSHISGGQMKSTRDSAERYVRAHMRPQDLFAVASFGVSMNILQSYTRDADKILAAIRQMVGTAQTPADINFSPTSASSSSSNRLGQTTSTLPGTLSSYQAETYQAARFLQALDALNSTLAQIRGRKALLLYSADFYAGAGIRSELMRTVQSARKAQVAYYVVDARGLNTLTDGGGGQGTGLLSNTASIGNTRARSNSLDWNQFEKIPLENLLRPLAKETDGLAIFNTSNFDQMLDGVNRELSNYYVLDFEPADVKRDGQLRALEVRTDVKGAAVKHPAGYFDPRATDALAGTKEEKALMTALAAPAPATQLQVSIRTAYVHETPAQAWIPISARIPAAKVAIKKKGNQMGGDLTIMGVALAEDGSIAARFSERQQILFDKAAENTFRQRNLTYRNYFRLPPGKYRMKLAVSDEQGKIGTAEQTLQIPPLPQSGLAVSSLLVAEQVSRVPDLVQNLEAGTLERSDPLTFSGLQLTLAAEHRLSVNAPLQVFFKLHNLSDNPAQRNLTAKVQLSSDAGVIRALPPTPLNQNLFPTGKSEAMVGIPLNFEKVPPGNYRLAIVVSEEATSQSVAVQTDLEFLSP